MPCRFRLVRYGGFRRVSAHRSDFPSTPETLAAVPGTIGRRCGELGCTGCSARPRRDDPLARDPGLAEAAAGCGHSIDFAHCPGKLLVDVRPAPCLVVPSLSGDSPDRTAADAGAARP